MNNKLFLNEAGFQEMILIGEQTFESTTQTLEESLKLDQKLLSEKGYVKTLIDVSEMGNIDPRSVELAASNISNTEYDKIAVFGVKPSIKVFLDVIIIGAKKKDSVKIFSTREEAVEWLKQ